MATAQGAPTSITFAVPITKVDKEKRLVRGIATAEVLDAQGQIVDYETAKAVIPEWIGNIREMHQPKAVGKRTAVEFDDANKQIILESYISKGAEDTWEKVLDGTLSMYSIHGSAYVKKDAAAPKGRLLMKDFDEISLVDNGACPVAKFEVIKSINGVSTDVQPADEAPVAKTEPAATPTPKDAVLALLAKFADDLKVSPLARGAAAKARTRIQEMPTTKVVKAYPEVYDIQNALGAIALLEQLLASEWYDAVDEAVNGEPEDGTDRAQLALLRNAVNLVIAFVTSEFDEQFSEFDEADAAAAPSDASVSMAKRKAAGALVAKFLSAIDVVGVVKAGARHSKADVTMIQKMHDTSVSLGAACGTGKAAPAAAAVPATPATEQPVDKKTDPAPAAAETTTVVAQQTPDLQTIVKAAIDEALKARQATSDQTIAELTKRVETLAGTPKPGGPIARAVPVDKTLAGTQTPASGAADPEADEIMRAFDVIAKTAKTPDETTAIAAKKLSYMHEHKLGVVQPVTVKP